MGQNKSSSLSLYFLIPGTHGTGKASKEKARGMEQARYHENVDKYGKENVENKQNPVGPNNPRRDKYMDAVGVEYQ